MTEKSSIITNRDMIKKWTEEREGIPIYFLLYNA